MKIDENLSESIAIQRGVHQACVLSPLLLELLLEQLYGAQNKEICINSETLNNISYPKNTVLIADNEEDLQLLLKNVDLVSNLHGLKIKTAQTKLWVLPRRKIWRHV